MFRSGPGGMAVWGEVARARVAELTGLRAQGLLRQAEPACRVYWDAGMRGCR